MQFAKLSTVANVIVGPILDSAGAEYTGAVIGDLSLSKSDATTLTAMAAAATLTHLANGYYSLVTIAGNTDTLGRLIIVCNKSTYQMPPKDFMVLPATVYDALVTNVAGGANGLLLSLASNQVDVGKILGTAVSTPATAGILDVNVKNIDNDAASASGTVTFPNATLASTTNITAGTITTATNVTTVNGLAANVITAAATATDFGAEVAAATWRDAVAADFTQAGSVGLSVMNSVALGTGLTVARCTLTDTLTTYTGNTVQTANVATLITTVGTAGAGLTDLGGMSTTMKAQVETEVDDALGGGTGTALTAIPWNASWDAEVQSEANDALIANNLDHLCLTAVADTQAMAEVVDNTIIGNILSKSASTTTYDPTTDSLEALRDNTGSAGAGLTAIDLPNQTMDITGNITGNLSGSVGSVTGAVGSVTGAVGSVTGAVGSVTGTVGGNVTGSIGSLATQAKADVNAEVLDVLNVDTFAEVGQEAPAATQTMRKMLAYLYKFLRNKKTQTSTTLSVFADDATTVDQKATLSDDATTFTSGEIASGP